jgi:hypothetical protein
MLSIPSSILPKPGIRSLEKMARDLAMGWICPRVR